MKTTASGFIAAIPIASGYIPVAITFGLIARSAELSTIDAVAASLFVFAGAAQFLAVGMYAAGLPVIQIIVAGTLLNLRHLLMSSVIARNLLGGGKAVRSALAFGVTDEVFGVASTESEIEPAFLAGLELGAYASWTSGTCIGAVLGDVLPPGLRTAMGLALYALFASLLAGQVRAARTESSTRLIRVVIAATVAIGLNVALRESFGVEPGTAFPFAMIGGAVAGMVVPERSAS
jgi:4-azaleucine resistance transporter AzlC